MHIFQDAWLTALFAAAEAFNPCINVSSTDADHRLDVDELVEEFITLRLASLLYDDGNCICGPPDDLSPPPNAASTDSSLPVPLVMGSCWWSPLTGDGEICCLTATSCCWPSSTKYDCDDDDEGRPDVFTDDWYSIELKLEFTLNLYSPIYITNITYGPVRYSGMPRDPPRWIYKNVRSRIITAILTTEKKKPRPRVLSCIRSGIFFNIILHL